MQRCEACGLATVLRIGGRASEAPCPAKRSRCSIVALCPARVALLLIREQIRAPPGNCKPLHETRAHPPLVDRGHARGRRSREQPGLRGFVPERLPELLQVEFAVELGVGVPGDHDHGQPGVSTPQALQHDLARHVGQPQVQKHDVGAGRSAGYAPRADGGRGCVLPARPIAMESSDGTVMILVQAPLLGGSSRRDGPPSSPVNLPANSGNGRAARRPDLPVSARRAAGPGSKAPLSRSLGATGLTRGEPDPPDLPR